MAHIKNQFILYLTIALGIFYAHQTTAMDTETDGFSIGRQIVSQKNILQVREEFDFTQFDIGSQILWDTILLYGITKSVGLELDIPVFLHRKLGPFKRRGMGDIALRAQWQFYRTPENKALFTGGLSFPTGHARFSPALGTGSFDILLALSFIHSSEKWFMSALFGPDITTKRRLKNIGKRRIGSILNYEFVFGPKFSISCINGGVLATLLELDAEYEFREKINGVELKNSGGHIGIFGPLISFERQNDFIIQGRIQLPIVQRLFGLREKIDFVAGFSFVAYF